jgi:hypothetical protein
VSVALLCAVCAVHAGVTDIITARTYNSVKAGSGSAHLSSSSSRITDRASAAVQEAAAGVHAQARAGLLAHACLQPAAAADDSRLRNREVCCWLYLCMSTGAGYCLDVQLCLQTFVYTHADDLHRLLWHLTATVQLMSCVLLLAVQVYGSMYYKVGQLPSPATIGNVQNTMGVWQRCALLSCRLTMLSTCQARLYAVQ